MQLKSDSRVNRIAKHSLLAEKKVKQIRLPYFCSLTKTYQAILLVRREKEKREESSPKAFLKFKETNIYKYSALRNSFY